MTEKIKAGRLYGVIAPILPDGEFVKCEPVFIDYWIYKNPSTFYIGKKFTQTSTGRMGISEFEEIDIRKFGKPIFLPANRKRINDGKKYFIVFQQSKNHTKPPHAPYSRSPYASTATDDSILPDILNVGILFPNKFVIIDADRELSNEELLAFIQ